MAGEFYRRPHEITWRDARGICRWSLVGGMGVVAAFVLLRLFVPSLTFPLVLFLPIAGLIVMLGRDYRGRSRFRLLLAVEAGLALPLALGHLIGLMGSVEELMLHVILLGFVPLFWSVYSLRAWAWGKERPFG